MLQGLSSSPPSSPSLSSVLRGCGLQGADSWGDAIMGGARLLGKEELGVVLHLLTGKRDSNMVTKVRIPAEEHVHVHVHLTLSLSLSIDLQ